MQNNRIADRNARRAEAKADYERSPVLCRLADCGKALSYGQFIRGDKFCSAVCGKQHVTSLKVGKPHATIRYSRTIRLYDSASWEGKTIRLLREDKPHFD